MDWHAMLIKKENKMNYKKKWFIGKIIRNYPSQAGNFPAKVIGYQKERNLNSGEEHILVRVMVNRADGSHEETFDPNLAYLFE
jgi:hypothetical protein